MEMPFYVADNHEYNWSDKILTQLTLQRNAARYNDKRLYESISKKKRILRSNEKMHRSTKENNSLCV